MDKPTVKNRKILFVPEGMKTAFVTTDEPYLKETPILKVGEDGAPTDPIHVDLLAKDVRALWESRLPQLWFIILSCSLYFLYILAVS